MNDYEFNKASPKDKELSYNFELIATAYHEIGHVVIGLLNFMVITSVAIEMAKDQKSKLNTGITYYENAINYDNVKDNKLFHSLIMGEIHISYAGLAAEKIFYKDICGSDKLPMVLKHGSYLDRDNVSEIINKYNLVPVGKERTLFKKKSLNSCIKSLESVWLDVKLLSHALYKRKRLNHDDLFKLLSKKSINKVFWKKQFKLINVLSKSAHNLYEKEIKIIMTPRF